MENKQEGLQERYEVKRLDGKPLKGDRCIVLEVGDPNAKPAINTFAKTVEEQGYVQLAEDLRELVHNNVDSGKRS